MRILCIFGRNHYGEARRGLGTEYVAFVPALERLGHKVDLFDSWETGVYPSLAELNAALVRTVDEIHPDIALFVPFLYEVWLETLDAIRAHGTAVACWTTDDSWKYEQSSRYFARHVDAIATTYAHIVPRYERDGLSNVLLTQWAAPSVALGQPLPARECRYRVSFVGTASHDRRKRIAALQARGIEVDCFGQGWASGSVEAERIAEIYRASAISLNFATSPGENQVKARTFEVPGAGGFLLTDPARDLEKFYTPGREIEVYHDLDELVGKTKQYLEHPEERDLIAQAGHARTVREHTYELRLPPLLDFTIEAARRRAPIERVLADGHLARAASRHRPSGGLKTLRAFLVSAASLVIGKDRGRRAARRLVYEMSWRLAGETTYRGAGWPGRMFPNR